MTEDKQGHLVKLPPNAMNERIEAAPQVACSEEELAEVLGDIYEAVKENVYISPTPTSENPALSDEYVFDTGDQNLILMDLKREHFVGKILDLSRGAARRRTQGYPQEYLYVFEYACKLLRRDVYTSGVVSENVLIYIKVNDRKIPYRKVFIISFHKNKPRNE